jgi:putative ABC transport system permease protein
MITFKNIFRKKVRSSLSITGVAIGIAAIVAFTSFAVGIKNSFTRFAKESGAELITFQKDAPSMEFSRVSKKDVDVLKSIPGVSSISRTNFHVVKMFNLPWTYYLGREPGEQLIKKYKNKFFKGELFKNDEEVMLGIDIASRLGKKPGDTITISKKQYRISGVFRTSIYWENFAIIMTFDELQRRFIKDKEDAALLAFVYLEDPKDWRKVVKEIEKRLPHLVAVKSSEVLTYFEEQIAYFDWFVVIISITAIIVGALGVLNTMMMNVGERIREVGTLRALGWTKFMVLKLIVSEGIVLSIIGGLVGLVFGYVGAEILIKIAPPGLITADYTPDTFLKAMVIALGVGIFGSLYPAYFASSISPVEALRYE